MLCITFKIHACKDLLRTDPRFQKDIPFEDRIDIWKGIIFSILSIPFNFLLHQKNEEKIKKKCSLYF